MSNIQRQKRTYTNNNLHIRGIPIRTNLQCKLKEATLDATVATRIKHQVPMKSKLDTKGSKPLQTERERQKWIRRNETLPRIQKLQK